MTLLLVAVLLVGVFVGLLLQSGWSNISVTVENLTSPSVAARKELAVQSSPLFQFLSTIFLLGRLFRHLIGLVVALHNTFTSMTHSHFCWHTDRLTHVISLVQFDLTSVN